APEDAGMRLAGARPVIPADPEHRRPARGAARAVDSRDVPGLDAEVVAEGRMRCLRLAELGLLDDGEAGEIVERPEGRRPDAALLPFRPVERAALPCVRELTPELGVDQIVARRGGSAFDFRQPARLVAPRPVARVVARRPDREVDAARAPKGFEIQSVHDEPARSAGGLRSREPADTRDDLLGPRGLADDVGHPHAAEG